MTDPSSKIYTRTGDTGETGLFDGTRVQKSDPRVDAYGDVDETASWLGAVRARLTNDDIASMLEQIQRDLFAVGAMLADPRHRIAPRVVKATLSDAAVSKLEAWIDALDGRLPRLQRFILAGGSETGAWLHVARAVCRRAERKVISLGPDATPAIVVTYLNRLSDLLFVMARAVNAEHGLPETEW